MYICLTLQLLFSFLRFLVRLMASRLKGRGRRQQKEGFVHHSIMVSLEGACKTCIPSRELTYPILGKGKSSSKSHFWGDMLVSWRVNGMHPSENSPVVLLYLPKSIKIPRPMHQKCWTVTPPKKNAMPKTCYSLFPPSTRTNRSLIFQVHKHPDPTTTTNCNCTATAPCPNRRHRGLHPLGRRRRILHGWGLEQGVHPI